MRIFLNYTRADEEAVRSIFELLHGSGFDPWMDIHKLVGGMEYDEEIQRQIKQSDMFLMCVSPRSVNKAGVIQREIGLALQRAEELTDEEVFVVPVFLERCELPANLSKRHWVDTTQRGWEVALIEAAIECQRRRHGAAAFSIEGGTSYPVVLQNVEEEQFGWHIAFQLARVIIPGDEQRGRELNEVIRGTIRRHVFEYRSMFDDWNRRDKEKDNDLNSHMDLSVSIAMCNADFYSMHIPVNNYFQGAAHPNALFETLTVFLPRITLVTLESIFADDSAYVETLRAESASSIVREMDGKIERGEVLEKLRQEWVKFDKFTVHETGMTFYFGDLLAHVYGPQVVQIDGAKLLPHLAESAAGQRLRVLWSGSHAARAPAIVRQPD